MLERMELPKVPGRNEFKWTAEDLPSGIYSVQIISDGKVSEKRVIRF